MAHSTIVGGSSAARVMACPASVQLSERVPPQPMSSYAAEGTALHSCMEVLMTDPDATLEQFIDVKIEGVNITADLVDEMLTPALDATNDAFRRFDVDEYEAEAVVHFRTIPGAFGTCDIAAMGRDDLLVLLDYKFGRGVMVSPVDNKQLMFYAAAMLQDPEFADWVTGSVDQPIAVGIIQPSAEHTLQTWMTTAGEVTRFAFELSMAVTVSQKPDPGEFKLGDHCRWCPGAAICPAKNETAANILDNADSMTLAEAKAMADEIEPWLKQVNQQVHDQLTSGGKVEGYKLTRGRMSNRTWESPDEVIDMLRPKKKLLKADYLDTKLKSPAQVEKLCKAKGVDFKKLTDYLKEQTQGVIVVPESDPREGVIINAEREIPENLAKLMQA